MQHSTLTEAERVVPRPNRTNRQDDESARKRL